MSFFKHVGQHNNKKIVIVQRSLPSEEHMASVIYSDIIPNKYHDDVMHLLESNEGQSANEFRDILGRRMSSDGGNLLNTLYTEGFIKKVPCNAVIVKPNSSSAIRLDELNSLLIMAGQGAEAKQKLESLERQQGYKDTRKEMPDSITMQAPGVLTDNDLARNNLAQASRLRLEATRLESEAVRLEEEAKSLDPSTSKVTKRARKSRTAA